MIKNTCQDVLHPQAKEGLRLFNQGRYFEAHEELEAAWRQEKSHIRDLYRGILQAAVTYLHIRRGNYPGAIKVYSRCIKLLNAWPDACRGVQVGQLRADLTAAIQEVKRLGPEHIAEINPAYFRPVIWNEFQLDPDEPHRDP